MKDLKRRAMRGAVKTFHAVRMVIVASVCLLIGISARHLIDAYAPDIIAALKKERIDAEVLVTPTPLQDLSVRLEPSDPH